MTAPGATVDPLAREFSLRGYRALLTALLEAGYQPATFAEPEPAGDGPALILRHDLDVDPSLALALAEVEADLGLHATYLVLLTSPLYNPATVANRATLAALRDLGHEVGLHFDAAPHASLSARDAALADELQILGLLLGTEVRVASFHRPGIATETPELPGVISAYEPRFTEDLTYLADSGGAFRFGHPLDSEAFAGRTGIQLLTHPIWWADQPLGGVAERIDAWHARQQSRMRNTLAANIRPYAEHLTHTGDHAL